MPTARYGLLNDDTNIVDLTHDLDTIDEIRENAKVRLATYQQQVARSYNKHVHVKIFRVGDLVLRKAFPNMMDPIDGKFAEAWEGPYLVDAVAGQGAYRLSTLDRKQFLRSWNALHLKAYHM